VKRVVMVTCLFGGAVRGAPKLRNIGVHRFLFQYVRFGRKSMRRVAVAAPAFALAKFGFMRLAFAEPDGWRGVFEPRSWLCKTCSKLSFFLLNFRLHWFHVLCELPCEA